MCSWFGRDRGCRGVGNPMRRSRRPVRLFALVAAASRLAAARFAAAGLAARSLAARLLVLGHQLGEEIAQRALLGAARIAARNGLAAARLAARNGSAAARLRLTAARFRLATGRLTARVDVATADVAAARTASAVQFCKQAERVGVRGAAATQQDGRGGCRQHELTIHRGTPTHPETNVCTILAPRAGTSRTGKQPYPPRQRP